MDLRVPVIGILRGIEPNFFRELMPAAFAAGLQAIEVTLNTPDAEKIIADCRPLVPEGCLLGMGTVCNPTEAARAVAAGAMFLVTPNLDPEVVALGHSHGVPVVAGALTPTEVYKARTTGADLIKIFPCHAMGGPKYIQDLLGPFNDAPLVPVGGVDAATANEYLKAGARALGAGSTLFGRQALKEHNVAAAAKNIQDFLSHCSFKAR